MASYTEAMISYTRQDSLIYEEFVQGFGDNKSLPIGELLVKTALYFQGKPYVASTLDKNTQEELVVNLREFDCTTFVESCIALARVVKSKDQSFSKFLHQLEYVRYRGGRIGDYSSRLHYMTDWISDNSQKNIFSDKSIELGGDTHKKEINFMSKHINSYLPLKNDLVLQRRIQDIENNINKRGNYSFIKKEEIKHIESRIENGDIIIFATSIIGLDYSHIGIAYWDSGKLTFVHASTRTNTVVIETKSLYDYCMGSAKCTGISVIRLNELKEN
jgi:Protein of unknown function (DUF1460).